MLDFRPKWSDPSWLVSTALVARPRRMTHPLDGVLASGPCTVPRDQQQAIKRPADVAP